MTLKTFGTSGEIVNTAAGTIPLTISSVIPTAAAAITTVITSATVPAVTALVPVSWGPRSPTWRRPISTATTITFRGITLKTLSSPGEVVRTTFFTVPVSRSHLSFATASTTTLKPAATISVIVPPVTHYLRVTHYTQFHGRQHYLDFRVQTNQVHLGHPCSFKLRRLEAVKLGGR